MQSVSYRYLFEIAVYSIEPDKFFAERDKRLKEHLNWLARAGGIGPDRAPDVFQSSRDHFLKKHGGWRYTQVIGWIRLFVLGKQIRGEYWFVNAKRINREMNKKKFEYWGKAFELSFFSGGETSLEIFQRICSSIECLKVEMPFKGRYIDTEAFMNIGRYVDWHNLIDLK